MADFYTTLGISRTATAAEIKSAYRQLAMKYHPDRNALPDSEEKFKSINEAYDTLGDLAKRDAYDKKITNPFANSRNQSYNTHKQTNTVWDDEDVFDMFRQRSKLSTQTHVVSISLKEAYTGKETFVGGKLAPLHVSIPAGVVSGKRIVIDQYNVAEINVRPHSKFKRAGIDLLVDVDITVSEAVTGICAIIRHIDDKQIKFNIPAGIQPGKSVRLIGKGMFNEETKTYGDLFIRCNVIIPTELTEEQLLFFKSLNVRQTIDI